jgi:hypothetical protein
VSTLENYVQFPRKLKRNTFIYESARKCGATFKFFRQKDASTGRHLFAGTGGGEGAEY